MLNTHRLDMILQVKYAVCNESGQNRLEWLKVLEMLWSELRLILKRSSVTPDFFYVFYRMLSFSTVSKSLCGKFLGADVLKRVKEARKSFSLHPRAIYTKMHTSAE